VKGYDPVKHFDHIKGGPFWAAWEPAVAAADRVAEPGQPAMPGPFSKDH
jgi:hypothetical protein